MNSKKFVAVVAALLSLAMFAAACGGSDNVSDETTVYVQEGEEIQIRSLNAITGDVAFLGIPNQRGVELAIEDFGPINGYNVTIGTGLDDLCSADGGQAAAQTIVADLDVVGVIGTSCSGAATAAAPLISAANMVMISPSSYYRTAHNDLFQGAAMAEFVYTQLGIETAAAIHDGDPYTNGLAQAFADAYESLGGTMTAFTAVNKEDTDMVPVLTEVAAGSPGALFFPIFQPAGDFIADQAPGVSGLGDTVLLAADGLLVDGFLELPQTAGMHFSGPDTRYGANKNESTGKTAGDFLAAYESNYGGSPEAPFWGHAYDATTLLLEAIAANSTEDGGELAIDRAGIRSYLDGVRGYSGIIGTVIRNDDPNNIDASKDNVVFEFAP